MGTKYTYHTNLDQLQPRLRNFVLCIDGTWNDPTDGEERGAGVTNVLRLHNALDRAAADHFVRYLPGVGNQEQHGWLGQLLGGAFGLGAHQIRDEAYAVLATNYRPGDRVFLFGFSRGAAIARLLANRIREEGIPESITISKDDAGRVVGYKNRGRVCDVDVEMLGVWDTVAAFGIPVNLLGIPFQEINLFKDMTIAANIRHAVHLLSVDENRDAFRPTLMNRDPERIEEVWFSGVHADVGGGYERRRLADVTLEYMMRRAETRGLRFHGPTAAEVVPNPDAQGVIHQHRRRPAEYKMGPREIGVLVDGTLDPACRPTLHRSVLRRMERLGDRYGPENVAGLRGRFEIAETPEPTR